MSNISKKFQSAVEGELFMETVAGGSAQPEVLVFRKVTKTGDWTGTVTFEGVQSEAEYVVDADDRYGRYPKLTDAKIADLRARRADLAAELAKYDHILSQVDALI